MNTKISNEENMPTLEMRVHHLDMLRCHIKADRSLEAIKENLILGKYDQGVTEEEFNHFAESICNFYEKILEGNHKIKLTSKTDGICDGGCTNRKIGGCDLKFVSKLDVDKAHISEYNVEVGKSYSLKQIKDVIKQYASLKQEPLPK